MIREDWFFFVAGSIGVISSVLDKTSSITNDVDGNVTEEDRISLSPPTVRDRTIYGIISAGFAVYGLIHILR